MLRALRRRLLGFEATTVVTSFNRAGYESYGQRFLETFERCWPANVRLKIYAEDVEVAASARVQVVPLLPSVPQLASFRARHQGRPLAGGVLPDRQYNYRFDALKFANKAFALAHAARSCSTPLLAWLDADTVTLKPVPADFVDRLLEGNAIAYLGRAGNHTETGFLAFDLGAPGMRDFFAAYEGMYTSDQIFKLREWHDCEVFDAVRATFVAQGRLRARDLSPPGTSHPFVNSVLGEYMDHLKGPVRKQMGHTPAQEYAYYKGVPLPPQPANLWAGRYAYIPRLVELTRPATIVEVGTWSGHRALQMAQAALRHGKAVHYAGFDLFEDATPEQDAAEKNVKPHYAIAQVEALLERFQVSYPGFTFELTKGDTREVLPEMSADLAFIDGGHSVETIRSDFERLRGSRVVVLDDWYEGGIDITRYGCNRVLEGVPHRVLPGGDPVSGGGRTHLAIAGERSQLEPLTSGLGVAA